MDLRGSSILARDALGAAGRILAERAGFGTAATLPLEPEVLATSAVLDRILQDFRPARGVPLPPVEAASLPGVDFESSNCRNFLIDVLFDERRDASDPSLPRTLYAKLPCEEITTRVFGNAIGFWPLECWFCEYIADRVPIRVPRVYAVTQQGSRFVLLLENLAEDPSVELFLNRDMARGTDVMRARRCLSAFAQLHAAFAALPDGERAALLPLSMHTYLSPRRRHATRALNAIAIEPAHRAAPQTFTPELARMSRMAIERWERLVEAWYEGPLTLVHGDSHLGNCFEYDAADGRRVGMIDFQAVHWSRGVRDVQYFLINSLDPKLLAEHEAELIEHYVAESSRFGHRLDSTRTKSEYRSFVFQTLMTAVVPLGLGSLTERDETVLTVLERACAAAARLDLEGWIQSL